MKVAILLLAAGRGTRLGAAVPKAFLRCAGVSLLERCVVRLAQLPVDREIIAAVHPDDRAPHLAPILDALRAAGLHRCVDGGDSRQVSMRRALAASAADCDLVLVHDAARPFFPLRATEQAISRAAAVGAALVAIPVPDTLKRVGPGQRVQETVDRADLWLAQTPQVAQRHLLEDALRRAEREGFAGTDDVSLLERCGVPVEVVPGSPTNIKITSPADLPLAERIAQEIERP